MKKVKLLDGVQTVFETPVVFQGRKNSLEKIRQYVEANITTLKTSIVDDDLMIGIDITLFPMMMIGPNGFCQDLKMEYFLDLTDETRTIDKRIEAIKKDIEYWRELETALRKDYCERQKANSEKAMS